MIKDKKIFYIGEKPIEKNDAGNKARLDINSIMEKKEYISIANISERKFNSLLEKIFFILNIKTLQRLYDIFRIKNKNIIIQYPFYYNFITRYALENIFRKDNNTIVFVHDLDSLRNFSKTKIDKEKELFYNAKVLILHNEKMKEYLGKKIMDQKIVSLDVFDYLLDQPLPNLKRRLSNNIAFAGNLLKSKFLNDLDIDDLKLEIDLYGPNFDKCDIKGKTLKYKGSFKPDVIPYKLEGGFGLIWDGTSLSSCEGDFGRYLKYNNPHKLSLYIAAGLPVITWKEAAIADFIKKYNIGFVVDSLYDIHNIINNTTDEQYDIYCKNMKVLQKKVCSGYFTNRALKEAEKLL